MKIIHVSDTHGIFSQINMPNGDLLIHSGDWTNVGSIKEIIQFNAALGKIKDKFKHGIILVPGNHDWLAERDPSLCRTLLTNATVLIDQEITIEDIRIYGSPHSPAFCNWAFNLPRGPAIRSKWDMIPNGIDILITHGPPMGVRDWVMRQNGVIEHLGCEELLEAVLRVRPQFHLFGHIHYANGCDTSILGITFINSSICNEQYKAVQEPHVFELTKKLNPS